MVYLILGPPGSGKSTQAELLAQKLGLPHISTGDIFREIAKQDTSLGKEVKHALDEGELVSDKATMQIIPQFLKAPKLRRGVVLDGFPRNLYQAQHFDGSVNKAIYLYVPDSEVRKRLLLRNRADDTEEIITESLSVYHQQTEPVLDYYQKQGVLLRIDGTPSIEEIHTKIVEAI